MLTRLTKIAAIIALLVGLFVSRFPGYATILQFIVSTAAVVVLFQAANMRRYIWMTLFVITACLFNPVVPVPFSTRLLGITSTFSLLLFFFSLELLRAKPRMSIDSI